MGDSIGMVIYVRVTRKALMLHSCRQARTHVRVVEVSHPVFHDTNLLIDQSVRNSSWLENDGGKLPSGCFVCVCLFFSEQVFMHKNGWKS